MLKYISQLNFHVHARFNLWCFRGRACCAGEMAAQLAGLGFAAADVSEALDAVAAAGAANGGALEACLDWLCMNVPEADLPPAFGPGAGLE